NAATAGIVFPEDLRFCESWAYSSAIAAAGSAAYLDIDTIKQHDHDGPRLTSVDVLKQTSSRIAVLENQWGKDAAFLQTHRAVFESRLDEERQLRIRELLANNQPGLARHELTQLHGDAPALLHMLSALPRPLV